MMFIVHEIDDKLIVTDRETNFILGGMFPALPQESLRNFEYSYGSPFFPKDVLNWTEIPRLAEVPFFTIDYTDLSFLCQPSQDLKYRYIQNLWWLENKINGRIFNAPYPLPPVLDVDWIYTFENPNGHYKIPIFAIEIDENYCYIGNREGLFSVLTHEGEFVYNVKLSQRISHIVSVQGNIYLTCDDGNLYHLQDKNLDSVYNARPENNNDYLYRLLGFCASGENLALVDIYGNLTLLNPDFQPLWSISTNLSHAINLNSDGERIFVGHSQGIHCYSCIDGQLLWQQPLEWGVMWQYLTPESLFFGCSDGTIYQLSPRFRWSTNYVKLSSIVSCAVPNYLGMLDRNNYIIVSNGQCELSTFNLQGELINKKRSQGLLLTLKPYHNSFYGTSSNSEIIKF